ncbi:serine/threonine-protein kinase [Streptomyces adonidis]|uniref:serine/threonine-protein kinase n=1 Tax=Streptomyces adonidis TaxID=3231367 RepID=UPI0034DB489A
MWRPLRHGEDPTSIGPFELLGRLGAGGMGSVYLARRAGGGLLVALKVIRPELCAEPGYRERFAREIETARAVRGVHTVHLVDFDAEAAVPWLATELVHGPNLAEVLATHRRLPADSLRVLAAGLAEGLGAIHAAGIVHRDVKPSNIILAESGPRLVDFGIARAVGQGGLTSTGQFVGSVVYASPEQRLGQRVGPESDLFSLGVVLAEAAGERVLSPQGAPLASEAVDGRTQSFASLPEDLGAVVRRCLARDPGDRPSSAEVGGRLAVPPRPGAGGTHRWLPDAVFRSVRRSSEEFEKAATHPPTVLDPHAAGFPHAQPTMTASAPGAGTARPGAGHDDPTVRRTHDSAPDPTARRRHVPVALSALLVLATAGLVWAVSTSAGGDQAEAGKDPQVVVTRTATLPAPAAPGDDGEAPRTVSSPSAPGPAEAERYPSAAPPGAPAFTRGALGVSRYRDPGYAATVTAVSATGHRLTVTLRARGEADLRQAETTCLLVDGPDGTFTVRPYARQATADSPGVFDGTLSFPMLVPGRYLLRYSCQDDYSDVELGNASVPNVGISRYSEEYFAVVLSADRTARGTQLVFAATGNPDLRLPQTSCLNQGGAEESPAVSLRDSATELNHYYYGAMDFRSGAAGGRFTYSCEDDYTPVVLP